MIELSFLAKEVQQHDSGRAFLAGNGLLSFISPHLGKLQYFQEHSIEINKIAKKQTATAVNVSVSVSMFQDSNSP